MEVDFKVKMFKITGVNKDNRKELKMVRKGPEANQEGASEVLPRKDGPQYANIIRVEVREGDVPNDVLDHIEQMSVLATNESSICVDGGYRPKEAMGELARAGADAGLSLGLMALGFDPNEAVDAVVGFRKSKGQKYGWHTDNHEKHIKEKGGLSGCGHANAAYTFADNYGLEVGKVKAMWDAIRDLNSQETRFVNLNREHKEGGILVVSSSDVTVLPRYIDEATGNERQFFVYDAERDDKLMTDLVSWLAEQDQYKKHISEHGGKEEFLRKFKEVIKYHTDVTLALLDSSHGRPMYRVTYEKVDSGYKAVVEKIGKAPSSVDEVEKPDFL